MSGRGAPGTAGMGARLLTRATAPAPRPPNPAGARPTASRSAVTRLGAPAQQQALEHITGGADAQSL